MFNQINQNHPAIEGVFFGPAGCAHNTWVLLSLQCPRCNALRTNVDAMPGLCGLQSRDPFEHRSDILKACSEVVFKLSKVHTRVRDERHATSLQGCPGSVTSKPCQ